MVNDAIRLNFHDNKVDDDACGEDDNEIDYDYDDDSDEEKERMEWPCAGALGGVRTEMCWNMEWG